ncbi:MAG: DNA polymerase III subunit alpha [Bacteroidetes bacterium]|nr:DNA polymerase III subunit alpha [Bacteroidota bacterium]
MAEFVHLHNHSQYSLLDGAAKIKRLVEKAVENGQKAIALTDHGNLYGAPEFYKTAKDAGLKPIVGSEFYITPTSMYEKDTKERYHLILLAKNLTGYKNLVKLSSKSFLEGYYYKPRIDRELLRKHSEGLIALTACIKGEVPNAALKGDLNRSRRIIDEYVDIFGDDFYLELQNHGIKEEIVANNYLVEFAKEKNVKLVATNDIHYISREDSAAHDILLCLSTGKEYNDPTRMKFTTDQVYFKSSNEMAELFKHLPEAIENTVRIADSIDFNWKFGETLLPHYKLPEGYESGDQFLEELCVTGLKKRYGEINTEISERLDFELKIIKKMGYSGYFLITQDFTQAARDLGVGVGPGRGSAAGSLVAYATGITNIDPLKYNLLFERFLNPERVSMPDIDMDFDDKGRSKVIDYVVNKYGRECVTQIITFGTMAARGAIRDVGRALGIPLKEVDTIAKMIPEGPGKTIQEAIDTNPDLREVELNGPHPHKQLIEFAKILEGSARHTSMHAAGVVIAPDDVTNYVPLHKAGNNEITTQYDKDWSEKIGLLKMDFLGLKTLSILADAVRMIKENYKIAIDVETLDETDEKTFELMQKGETIGVFQFESEGMRDYLKKLKPTSIEDMIAMNALYRPGPLGSGMVESFINRKHGQEEIDYFHPALEPILKDTYGVIVYQEQVMQIAQKMGGYSLGAADLLRRAMGKKKAEEMEAQKDRFQKGAAEQNIDPALATKVFDLMAHFAGYGFNKSHSAAYAVVAYQTAFLKAHYPAEFMAACLNSELSSTDKIVFFIHECKRMGIDVLPPDVNESATEFSVVNGKIRFGMAAVKNVGIHAVESIIASRKEQGPFTSFFGFFARIDLKLVNKKVLESLIQVGAFDSLPGHRAQKFDSIERAISYAQNLIEAENRGQSSLFDTFLSENHPKAIVVEPGLVETEPWKKSDILAKEKEYLGFYVSGHIMDGYRSEYESFARQAITGLNSSLFGQQVTIMGIITTVTKKVDKKGNMMGFFGVEDFYGNVECIVFSKSFEKLKDLIVEDNIVLVSGKLEGNSDADTGKILVENIQSVDDVRKKRTGSVQINLNLSHLNEESIRKVKNLLVAHQGSAQVYLELSGQGLQRPIRMLAKNYSVNISPSLADSIQSILGEGAMKFLN